MGKVQCLATVAVVILWTTAGCHTTAQPTPVTYEARVKRAEAALRDEKIFEAKRWAEKALELEPKGLEAQRIIAKVFDRQITQEKILSPSLPPEDLSSDETALRVKTLLERSRTLLEMNLLKEANDAAHEALQLDPESLEASRLLDTIKEKARQQGREESLFIQDLYEEEIQSRVEQYTEQAKAWVAQKRWGAARLALEKILLLDPSNGAAKRLLAKLDKEDESAWTHSYQEASVL